jgi:ABC-type phosphate/phosphonate transport system substrate-binding protein
MPIFFKALVLALCLSCLPAWGSQLYFAVNEGTSSSQDNLLRSQKYKGLINRIGQATGRKVVFETSNVLNVLERNLASQRYDLAFVRPNTLTARAIRDHGYRLVAMAKGELKVHFIVPPDSPLKEIKDIKGRFVLMPEKQSAPTKVALAVMRDQGLDPAKERVQMLNQQEAVLYSL